MNAVATGATNASAPTEASGPYGGRVIGEAQIADVARLLGDPTRAAMCTTMLDGRFHTAGELARAAGLRVATVSNIALVSVAAVVGGGALGRLFDRGLASRFYTPLIVGLVLSVLLALLADALILLLQRNTLPWARGRRLA